jgi:uncharacterized protein (TIGR02271 family)
MDREPETDNLNPVSRERETGRPTTVSSEQRTVIPVIAEEIVVGRKAVKTGAVRVHKRVHERVERVEMPVIQDALDVRRVVVNRVVAAAPGIRKVGDTTIIPVVEEELVVTKRLVLKEELHVTRRRVKTRATREVTLRREEARIEKVDAQGRPLPGKVVRAPRRNPIIPEN